MPVRCDGSEVCRIPLLWAERRGRGAGPAARLPSRPRSPGGGPRRTPPSPLGWRRHRGAGREVGAVERGGLVALRGWVRRVQDQPRGVSAAGGGETRWVGGWAPKCCVCAGGTGDRSDPWGQQRSQGLHPGWGGSWGHPQGWGVPRVGGTLVLCHPGHLGGWAVPPLPSNPSQARVPPATVPDVPFAVGTPGVRGHPSPSLWLGAGWGERGPQNRPGRAGAQWPARN